MWFLWDKENSVNGISASEIINNLPKPFRGVDLFLKLETDNKISAIQTKEQLAEIFEVDGALPIEEFLIQINEKFNIN